MLLNLYVKNFAIIKEISVDFEAGLNIISGETGSGKSLLLKALDLLKGDRFSKEYIGIFDDRTLVEAVFTSHPRVNEILTENGYDTDDNIILTRTFTQNSSVTKINNRPCNIKLLTNISSLLFDIHGQHSSLIVLDKANYFSLIDSFDERTIKIKNDISKNLNEINILNKELGDLELSPDQVAREKDILIYQIKEIESFNFDDYDEDKLNKEHKKLSNQKELISGTNDIIDFLTESSRKASFKEMASILYDKLYDLSKMDDDLASIASDALNIKEVIIDLSRQVESYSYGLEIDDERLQIIEDQFLAFQVLKNKYGRDQEEILSFLEDIKTRYKLLNNIEKTREDINKHIQAFTNENIKLANELTSIRLQISNILEKRIVNELSQMNMDNIQFKIEIEKADKINKNGQDIIDFLISTNKGQDMKSLSQVSSGGEISRFMLAMKAAISEKDQVNTIIFDEIDTGISGKTADIVGDKLKKISKSVQLIVISHLAQIASKSDNHYLLSKQLEGDKTVSQIRLLDKEGKIQEIARLISGSDITNSSLVRAKELLEG